MLNNCIVSNKPSWASVKPLNFSSALSLRELKATVTNAADFSQEGNNQISLEKEAPFKRKFVN